MKWHRMKVNISFCCWIDLGVDVCVSVSVFLETTCRPAFGKQNCTLFNALNNFPFFFLLFMLKAKRFKYQIFKCVWVSVLLLRVEWNEERSIKIMFAKLSKMDVCVQKFHFSCWYNNFWGFLWVCVCACVFDMKRVMKCKYQLPVSILRDFQVKRNLIFYKEVFFWTELFGLFLE